MSCRHAIYFNHFYSLHPDHPHMLLWTFAILCFFFLSWMWGRLLEHGQPTKDHTLKISSPSHGSPRFSVASQRWALGCPVSSPCCHVDWFHLVQVLCRGPQPLWVHGCPAFPNLWLLESLCPIFQGISWSLSHFWMSTPQNSPYSSQLGFCLTHCPLSKNVSLMKTESYFNNRWA